MLKSTLDKVNNDAGLVTPSSIGFRVLVANSNNEIATSGILRFVGELDGQDGLFCGVELSEPFGKNDGSYKGVYFFRCPQNHGLFLPIHRVRLAEKRQSQSSTAKMPMQRPDRLIKSVFPSINTSLIGSQHYMDVSMMSTNSSNWVETSDDDGDMFDSCTTYNVARPQFMLQEVEDPRPLFAMDEDEYSPTSDTATQPDIFSNGNISTSYVVTNPMMDRRDLPIIGTPPVTDDLETPLVEEKPFNGNFIHETATNSYSITENIIAHPHEKEANTVNGTPPEKKQPKNKSPINGSKTPVASQPELTPQQKQEKREKKQRVSLREMITAPPKPIQQEKPKKISKQQQLMEQILNNMKEQKDVPKKEKLTRTKISDLWSQPPPLPPPSTKTVSNGENDGMTQQKIEEEKTKRALKVINHPPAKPRNPPKPRQSLLPPKVAPTPKPPTANSTATTENNEGVKMRSPTKNVSGFRYGAETTIKVGTTRNSQTDASSGTDTETAPASTTTTKRTSRLAPIPRRPLSQVSGTSSKSSTTSKAQPSTTTTGAKTSASTNNRGGKTITKAIKKPNEFERKLIQHYKRVSRISTVMSLVSGNIAVQLDALQFKYNLGNDTIAAKNLEIEHLQTTITNLEESYKDQIKTLKEQHQEEFQKSIQTKDSEYQQIIKELKQAHLAEIDDRDVSYLQVDTQLKEAQRKIEELRKALNEGTDAKITTLNLEIKSLQDMLEIKNKETTELLKSRNRLVALQEKFDELEKDFKALQCEFEQESYNFKMNRDVNRSLRAENNRKDFKIEELLFKIDKLEKRQNIYQQRIDELETTNHASGHANTTFLEGSFNNSFIESEEDSTETDTDSEKIKRRSLLSTYQEAGRKAMADSVHQDVIHCPEGKYHEDDEDEEDTASQETPLLESDDPETF
jgi:hypothetical protein